MALPAHYRPVTYSEHVHPEGHTRGNPTPADEPITATLILRRRSSDKKLKSVDDFGHTGDPRPAPDRKEFSAHHGADPGDLEQVAQFAENHGLKVVESSSARRSVVVKGTADAMNRAFAIELHDYNSPRGKYHGHEGPPNLPESIANIVETVTGLDNRRVPAQHYSATRLRNPADPANTRPLTPQQVAALYHFPSGNGANQVIGLYEMETASGPAGYDPKDISDTMHGFGLPVPALTDVAVDGVANSRSSDGETGLDITVAGAVAPAARIAVYFTGGTVQAIIRALQAMIHPQPGDPEPGIISISYGWGPDNPTAHSFSPQEYAQIHQLFQDAANLNVTVLVSSGDSGVFIAGATAQTSYPASEPWVIACGGTTIGNIQGNTFDEFVWNDTGKAGPGATGGGISDLYLTVPAYQAGAAIPKNVNTGKPGRGVPDIAGNASENSGYVQFIKGKSQPVGGTSAVAPLYAGLIARINANLGQSVGFINPVLYSLAGTAFRNIVGAPGPADNSFRHIRGYPAGKGWDACTGLGSVNGQALQDGLAKALQQKSAPELAEA